MPAAEATREVVLRLPESLAHDAECAGLLTSEAVATLVKREMGRRGFQRLRAEFDALGPDHNPPMTMDEISAVVREVRAEMLARDPDSWRQ